MTIIAFKDNIIAADTLVVQGSERHGHTTQKIWKHGNFLFGFCGVLKMLEQVRKASISCRPGFDLRWGFPDWKGEGELMIVDDMGGVYFLEGQGGLLEYEADYYAMGAGAAVALGAMCTGATATEAVSAAIQHSECCGGEIVWHKVREIKVDAI